MNADDDFSCSECGVLLDEKKESPDSGTDDFAAKISKSVHGIDISKLTAKKKADIMFVFDITSSMRGEIRAMQDAIIDFATSIVSDGLDIRLGLISFMDRTVGKEHKLFKFSDGVFTDQMPEFQEAVNSFRPTPAGPAIEESSPDALMLALGQKFRDCPNKTIVLVTDAPPRIPDKEVKSYKQVLEGLVEKDINQFYLVTRLSSKWCQVHLKFLETVQGNGGDGLAFEISSKDDERKENFKKVLRGLAKSISTKSVTM